MPNKNTPNAFYMFMLDEQKKIKAQTKRAPTMHELPAMCRDTWKNLSAAEKAYYDNLAKQEKARQRGGSDKDKYRKDNQRQIIAYRRDPVAEKEKRRRHETDMMQKSWTDKDLLGIVFHVIDFQVMYDERHEDHHLPLELGMTAFTLRDGLRKSLHFFINPGEVPQGNKHLAFKHSENTHKIPMDFEQGDKNIRNIWRKINDFVKGDGPEDDEIPPLYCLSDNTEVVEGCLDFLYMSADVDEPNLLHKVYCMEDLVTSLIMKSGTTDKRPVLSQVNDALRQNIWDFTSSIRCAYHDEIDCSYCSMSIVKRHSFAVFDMLTGVLGFALTANHVPEQTEQQFQVLAPEAFGRAFHRGNRRKDFGRPPSLAGGDWKDPQDEEDDDLSAPQRYRPRQERQEYSAVPAAVGRFEINLSDEDDDDGDEESVAYGEVKDEELKSTHAEYHLKELRKPKTLSMLQFASGEGPPVLARLGRGAPLYMAVAAQSNQPGAFASRPAVPPPPGFGMTRPVSLS
ncbi:hypothetical protein EGW08_008340 [Elysia chlorotica]|uniref:HMG box domain-containing protein n=1 Tax=Elysia chlorotica TaxID=188477 RepID=A0A3S1HQ32_ELYCH|nr:hypothetical protein EGW08_008340 [Elysia chlorotica]